MRIHWQVYIQTVSNRENVLPLLLSPPLLEQRPGKVAGRRLGTARCGRSCRGALLKRTSNQYVRLTSLGLWWWEGRRPQFGWAPSYQEVLRARRSSCGIVFSCG